MEAGCLFLGGRQLRSCGRLIPFGVEQTRSTCIIDNAEPEFVGIGIEPRAAPHNLLKENGRIEGLHKDHVAHGGGIHTRREQFGSGRHNGEGFIAVLELSEPPSAPVRPLRSQSVRHNRPQTHLQIHY